MLLLHHIGARSAEEHVNPSVHVRDGDDLLIAASKGGAPDNPAWHHDLKAHRPPAQRAVGRARPPAARIVERGDEGDDVVVDPDGVLTHALGVADGGLALVRPDGYVGLVSTDVDPDTLRRYLTAVLHVRDEALAQGVAR